ncbi:sn-glycerol-3-phosphate import ATP-binding protein UgpC [Pacificispira sp.]|uniref:sn-glycerol-3-phosphate import ATP-binding protein UgpC n=1 Tax=Pacificispira sp. TaxID=2888761 RepID=UPI003B516873
MSEISIRSVEKRYDNGAHAVRGVSIDVQDGELVVLLGPSGCGKSTLLRMVAGLESVTEGEIAIDGKRINDVSPSDRDVAMVFQNYALYPHMSVFDNLAYGLKNRRVSKDEIRRRVDEAAAILEIGEYLERKPRQLSGGQRQRVAMGRAIVREPKAFLFDEPLSNLDAKLRVHMRVEIKRLQRRLGVTSLYVTHDQVEAMTLGDRLIVLNQGVAEQIGTPLELYERPETLFVAGFIGTPAMNLLPGRLENGGMTLETGGLVALPDALKRAASDAAVTLGIRPEHVRLDDTGEVGIDAAVELIEHLGADILVHARAGEGGALLTARLPGDQAPPAGDRVKLSVSLDRLNLFDSESGRRVVSA